MSSSHSKFSSGRSVSGLFLVVFSLTVLFLMVSQLQSLPVASGVVRVAADATTTKVETLPFPPQQTVVVIVATSTTTATSLSTTTSLSTSLATTTSVQTTTVLQTLTQTVSTTSTSLSSAGIGGLSPSMNIPIVIAVLIIGIIGGVVGTTTINSTKSNTFRTVQPPPAPPTPVEEHIFGSPTTVKGSKSNSDNRTMSGFCGKCGKPATNGVCSGCAQPTTTCTCGGSQTVREIVSREKLKGTSTS